MSTSQLVAGGALLLTVGQVALTAILPERLPFMTVHSVEVAGGQVVADREYWRNEPTIADWTVTVVSDDGDTPSCSTVTGPELHQGWSKYSGRSRSDSAMHIDVWVNDVGCAARLSEGRYFMSMTWTPRDGTKPVTEQIFFEWSG